MNFPGGQGRHEAQKRRLNATNFALLQPSSKDETDGRKATNRPGPRRKKGGSTPSILRTCSPIGGPANPQNSQWSRQAGGEKRGLYAPNFRLCSQDQRRGKPQNSQWSRQAGGAKKGSPRPQFCAPAAKPKGQAKLYHCITISL